MFQSEHLSYAIADTNLIMKVIQLGVSFRKENLKFSAQLQNYNPSLFLHDPAPKTLIESIILSRGGVTELCPPPQPHRPPTTHTTHNLMLSSGF